MTGQRPPERIVVASDPQLALTHALSSAIAAVLPPAVASMERCAVVLPPDVAAVVVSRAIRASARDDDACDRDVEDQACRDHEGVKHLVESEHRGHRVGPARRVDARTDGIQDTTGDDE